MGNCILADRRGEALDRDAPASAAVGSIRAASGRVGVSHNVPNRGRVSRGPEPVGRDAQAVYTGLNTIEAALAQIEAEVRRLRSGDSEEKFRHDVLVQRAEELYRRRRRRHQVLGNLASDPAWDMLLDLFVRTARGEKTPVKNLCLAACAPTSTALRWMDRLESAGLITKAGDQEDARRLIVELSEMGSKSIAQILS